MNKKKEFCLEKCDLDFPANQEIFYNLFTILLDIAANLATNRNEAIQNMLGQINCDIGNINVSGLVKKYNNRLKKLYKLTSESEKQQLLNTSIIEMKNNTKFPFLYEAYLRQDVLKEIKEFKLTNGIFYDICLALEKCNITWDTICQLIMKKLNCSGVLPQSLSPTFINLKIFPKHESLQKKNIFYLSHSSHHNQRLALKQKLQVITLKLFQGKLKQKILSFLS